VGDSLEQLGEVPLSSSLSDISVAASIPSSSCVSLVQDLRRRAGLFIPARYLSRTEYNKIRYLPFSGKDAKAVANILLVANGLFK
jgi:hypothetical protein